MRCQTSPRYQELKYGSNEQQFPYDFAGEGGFLYWLSSKLLFMETDEQSCLALGFTPPSSGEWKRRGSLSLLWPLFQALWIGQFVETMSTVLQGRPLATETGLSIFEHSLAFAEAEGALSNTVGASPFNFIQFGRRMINSSRNDRGPSPRILLRQMNTTPENLLFALISALNNLSSQVLGVFDKQARFRLVNTGTWGICYIAALAWGFYNLDAEAGPENILMRFPVVCVIGFTPHVLILTGILICISIYLLSFTLSFLCPPNDVGRRSYSQRLSWAYKNVLAYIHFSNVRIQMRQDFYAALLQTGALALTVASEAVFLNERKKVSVARWTWLEEQRLDEFETLTIPRISCDPEQCTDSGIERCPKTPWKSGYSRLCVHKTSRTMSLDQQRYMQNDAGVGAFARIRRCIDVYDLFTGIIGLILKWMLLLLKKGFRATGIQFGSASNPETQTNADLKSRIKITKRKQTTHLDFWMLSDDGVLTLPNDDHVDVEAETKRRLTVANDSHEPPTEEQLSTNLYDWWKHGGWWGDKDESGSYAASVINDDEDTTSVVSMSTTADGWETDDEERENLSSGQTTPTQKTLSRLRLSSSPTPEPQTDHTLDPLHLASLLDPKTKTARQEAKMLAHHLAAPSITTRSQYSHATKFANAKVLTSSRFRPEGSLIPSSGPLTPEEEAELLEYLIISRRSKPPSDGASSDGLGTDGWRNGPQCVVCQCAPRTVLAWPCKCLSLCEDCRVSLAMNNFGTCVCCRQDVVGFSRLFVP